MNCVIGIAVCPESRSEALDCQWLVRVLDRYVYSVVVASGQKALKKPCEMSGSTGYRLLPTLRFVFVDLL